MYLCRKFLNMSENATSEPVKMPGKYELIKELSKYFPQENSSTIVAVGDDASVIEPDANQMVTSSDLFSIAPFGLQAFHCRFFGCACHERGAVAADGQHRRF